MTNKSKTSSNRKTYNYQDNAKLASPKESEITTYTENTTTQSVPSLRAKNISLTFVDPVMEKGFRKWSIEKYDRFHVFLYGMILIWVSLLFVFEYLTFGTTRTNYFRIGYYGIAIVGILITKLTVKHNDLVLIGLTTLILVISTIDDVQGFNLTSEYTSIESNWYPMLIILHSSMSLIHVRYWLLVTIIPLTYLISLCISRSFYLTSKVTTN